MKNKVLLILCDGMRPDAITECAHPFAEKLMKNALYTSLCRTVMPSVTLPCHMSLFHSVDTSRHGIVTNIYTPQVRPVNGIAERLHSLGKSCGMVFDWEPLRDLARPGNLCCSILNHSEILPSGYNETRIKNTAMAIDILNTVSPDFLFFYIGLPDEVGHKHGWMSEEYIESVRLSWESIEQTANALPGDYSMIITADHGGHGRGHGDDSPEDMTIPLFFTDERIDPAKLAGDVSILDIAPTVAELCGVTPDSDWEGKSLLRTQAV